MQESGPGGILSNVCAALAAQLLIDIFCDSHNYWHGSYDRTCRHTGWFAYLAQHAHDVTTNRSAKDYFHFIFFGFQKHSPISPEIYCYLLSILVVWIALISSFKEDLIARQTWIPNFASVVTIISLVVLDIMVPLYHSFRTHVMPPLRPAYDSYVVFAIYIFLPMSDNIHTAVLGVTTTICYLILMGVMTYRLDPHVIVKVYT